MMNPISDQLWITRDGEQYGPYSREDAVHFLKSGSLRPDDLAWFEGQENWKPLKEVLASNSIMRRFSGTQLAVMGAGAAAILIGILLLGLGPFSTRDNVSASAEQSGVLGGTEADVEKLLGTSTGKAEPVSSTEPKDYAKAYFHVGDRVVVQYTPSGKARVLSIRPQKRFEDQQVIDRLLLATGETTWRKDRFIEAGQTSEGLYTPSLQMYESGSGTFYAHDIRNEHPMVSPWIYEFIVYARNLD
jgi:hypothetical protein